MQDQVDIDLKDEGQSSTPESPEDSTSALPVAAGEQTAIAPSKGPGVLAWSVRDVADALSCSTSHVWRCVAMGILPPPIKIGTATRWLRADIERTLLEASHARSTASSTPPSARRR